MGTRRTNLIIKRLGDFCGSDTFFRLSVEFCSIFEDIRGFYHARRTRTLQKQPIREQSLQRTRFQWQDCEVSC